MKITLETKFNIGDQVYLAETYREYWANSKSYTVVGIKYYINEHTSKTLYNIEQGELKDSVSETLLFATYDECVQWCKEHN